VEAHRSPPTNHRSTYRCALIIYCTTYYCAFYSSLSFWRGTPVPTNQYALVKVLLRVPYSSSLKHTDPHQPINGQRTAARSQLCARSCTKGSVPPHISPKLKCARYRTSNKYPRTCPSRTISLKSFLDPQNSTQLIQYNAPFTTETIP
jgi:hypothetical protein